MKKILLSLLLLISLSRGIDTLTVPTDFNTVTSGTRANLSTNFTSIQTWGNKVRDSIAQVTARLSGGSGTLLLSSLSNLRLKLDADNTETARLLVESGTGDSLFTVSEDTTAKFYGPLTLNKTLTATGKAAFSDSIVGVSERLSGTLVAANGTYSGTLGVSSTQTNSEAIVFNANGTPGSARIFKDATNGMVLRGAAGSARDLQLQSAAGTVLLQNTTGTSDVAFPNQVNFTSGSGVNFTTAPIISSATASTDAAFDASKNLISVAFTGSGSGVRATSPTLITPILGAATATTIALGGNEAFDYNEGTFTCTLSGFTTTVNGTCRYTRVGKAVSLFIPILTGTSNTNDGTLSGLPAEISPARTGYIGIGESKDNAGHFMCDLYYDAIGAPNSFEVLIKTTISGGFSLSGFTTSGTKGFDTEQNFHYTVQ